MQFEFKSNIWYSAPLISDANAVGYRLHLEQEVKVLDGKLLELENYFFNLAYLLIEG